MYDFTAGHDQSPLTDVREGMGVVDADGARLGVVEEVKLGDPGAVTDRGQTSASDDGLVALIRDTFAGPEPHAAAESAARLRRLGYVKIDRRGLFDRDLYAAADQVDRVTDDTVNLAVRGEELTAEF